MQAIADGVAEAAIEASLADELREYVWDPVYQDYERIGGL
jgi:hypothetical protein